MEIINEVKIQGTLANEVRIASTQKGTMIASFSVACPTGKFTNYVSCKAFGELASAIERHSKGDLLSFEGHINSGSYEREGRKVYTQEVVVDRMNGLDIEIEYVPIADDIPF